MTTALLETKADSAVKTFYFAHSMLSYDTKWEKYVVFNKFNKHNIQVICPNLHQELLGNPGNRMDKYLKAISRFDGVLVSDYSGFIGRGVYLEVQEAFRLNKPVYKVTPGKIKVRPVIGVKQYDTNDWKLRYATLLTDKTKEVIL